MWLTQFDRKYYYLFLSLVIQCKNCFKLHFNHTFSLLRGITKNTLKEAFSLVNLTNSFGVAMHLFSIRSQMT